MMLTSSRAVASAMPSSPPPRRLGDLVERRLISCAVLHQGKIQEYNFRNENFSCTCLQLLINPEMTVTYVCERRPTRS